MKKIAILDICGTIYDSNTTFDFFESIASSKIEKKLLKIRENRIIMLLNLFLFKLTHADLYRKICIRFFLTGKSIDNIEMAVSKFHDEVLAYRKISETSKIIQSLSCDYDFIICSASIDPVVRIIAKNIGCNDYFATQISRNEDCYTGMIESDLLGKKYQCLNNSGIVYDLVITDNKSDLDIIKNSNKSIIISKNKDLKYWSAISDKYKHVEIEVVRI